MKNHDPGSGIQPRNSGLKGPHTYAQPFLTSNGTWPTSLLSLSSSVPPPTWRRKFLRLLCTFALTDRLETRQQTLVLFLGKLRCPLHVLGSCILRSFEFDGQELLVAVSLVTQTSGPPFSKQFNTVQ
jgi:hypothetical protein